MPYSKGDTVYFFHQSHLCYVKAIFSEYIEDSTHTNFTKCVVNYKSPHGTHYDRTVINENELIDKVNLDRLRGRKNE